MADEKELPIADFTSIQFDGPGVLFVRPKRTLSDEEMKGYMAGNGVLVDMFRRCNMHVEVVLVPHDVEVLAIGEVEMTRHGWMRIPTPDQEPAK